MGNGTNLLALDYGLNKAVIKISDAMSEITLIDDETILWDMDSPADYAKLCEMFLTMQK